MAKLWDLELELKALKTILTPASPFAQKMFSASSQSWFYHKSSKALYERVAEIAASDSMTIPSLDVMLGDPKIPQDIRESLSRSFSETPAIEADGDFNYIVTNMNGYARLRTIYSAAQLTGAEILDADPSQVEAIAAKLYGRLAEAEEREENAEAVFGDGYNDTAEAAFCRIMYGEIDDQLVKSGWREFDEKTGGFRRGNLVVLGANSGGGKSMQAVNMMINQYRLGYNTVMASYEMGYEEIVLRMLANISEVDMNDIGLRKLTPKQIDRVDLAWKEFNLCGKEKGNHFTLMCPTVETTVPQVGFRVKNKKPTTIILDYINLLAYEGDLEAQWQILGEVSKQAKRLARKLDCVVFLLAQIDDTYNLRYSKAIKDHADFVMGWIRDDTAKRDRVLTIKQMKARNAPLYDFMLNERFDLSQFRDEGQVDRTEWPDPLDIYARASKCGLIRGNKEKEEFVSKQKLELDLTPKPVQTRRITLRDDDEENLSFLPKHLIKSKDLTKIDDYESIKLNVTPRSIVSGRVDEDVA